MGIEYRLRFAHPDAASVAAVLRRLPMAREVSRSETDFELSAEEPVGPGPDASARVVQDGVYYCDQGGAGRQLLGVVVARLVSAFGPVIVEDWGNPTLPVYYIYHNTFLLPGKPADNCYAHTWGSHTGGTTRRVFNNICVQVEGLPGLNVAALSAEDDFRADGSLHWGVKDGPGYRGDFFGKFRPSPLFAASKKRYPPGWGASDLFADPRFIGGVGGKEAADLSLQKDNPAIDAGIVLPAEWPDPLRKPDQGKPDIGAFPQGAEPLRAGPVVPPTKR